MRKLCVIPCLSPQETFDTESPNATEDLLPQGIAGQKVSLRETMRNDGKGIIYYLSIIIAIIFSNLLIMHLSGHSPFERNIYNSYALQAKCWLDGRLDLGTNYSHLEIAEYGSKFFISFPPLPSILLLPFVLIFGTATPDHILTLIATVIAGIYAYKFTNREMIEIARHVTIPSRELSSGIQSKALIFSLLLCIGSNLLFLSNRGYVWFMAQVLAFMFTLLSLYYACGEEKKTTFSLLLFCCALGCRPINAVYLPLLLYMLYEKNANLTANAKKLLISAIPAVILGCVYMLLNYLRFGSIFEFGHNYLPEFTVAHHGQFNIAYLSENFKTLWRMPYMEDGRLRFHAFNGTAFWLVSPVYLLYAVTLAASIIKNRKIKFPALLIFISISLHILLLCTHKTMGGWHFGHRYTVDALPAVFVGFILSYKDVGERTSKVITTASILLLFFGVVVNVVGTVWLYRGLL